MLFCITYDTKRPSAYWSATTGPKAKMRKASPFSLRVENVSVRGPVSVHAFHCCHYLNTAGLQPSVSRTFAFIHTFLNTIQFFNPLITMRNLLRVLFFQNSDLLNLFFIGSPFFVQFNCIHTTTTLPFVLICF